MGDQLVDPMGTTADRGPPTAGLPARRSTLPALGSLLLALRPSGGRRSVVGGRQCEERFVRILLIAAFLSALLIAAIGFIQRFSWNGKILWFFVPYDWGDWIRDGVQRASGPFVNADHFANYLLLILPLAIAGVLSARAIVGSRLRLAFAIGCAASAFLLLTGILLSLSRSGWIAALVSLLLLSWLRAARTEQGAASEGCAVELSVRAVTGVKQRVKKRRRAAFAPAAICNRLYAIGRAAVRGRRSAVAFCILLIVALVFVGESGRGQVDARLGETVRESESVWGRTAIWKDSIGIVRDFPLFGVGLGAWPELFVRYRSLPWAQNFFREAHNDYLELLAETGIIGAIFLGWFFWRQGRVLLRAANNAASPYRPVIAAIIAALSAMAFHEFFDFNLQIPANACLFTILLAIGLRMARSTEHTAASNKPSAMRIFHPAVGGLRSEVIPLVASGALVLAACALVQEQTPYPYKYRAPKTTSLEAAQQLVLSRPTSAPAHLNLLRHMGDRAPAERQLATARAALWTEPNNPALRDMYAATLLRVGKKGEAHMQITRSIAASPSMETHLYLKPDLMTRLSDDELAAVEEGFRQALARGDLEAADGLAIFYAQLDRFSDEARLYEETASREIDAAKKLQFLLNGGVAYLKANDERGAELLLNKAIAAVPSDPRAYEHLISGNQATKNIAQAEEIVSQGIQNGAPALPLYLALAEAAQKTGSSQQAKQALTRAGDAIEKGSAEPSDPFSLYLTLADGSRKIGFREQEIAALRKALELRPGSKEILFRLAGVYLEQNNFNRAALYFSRVTNVDPAAADAYYNLAIAEESRYRFDAADKAYKRAVELAPSNSTYQQRYDAFRKRLEQNMLAVREGKATAAKLHDE